MSDLDDASDVHASAERLTAFLEADEPEIRRRVASNPNTPLELLVELIERSTANVLKNPALAFHALVEPDFWDKLSPRTRRSISRSASVPAEWLTRVAHHGNDETLTDLLWQNPAVPQARRLAFFFSRSSWPHDPTNLSRKLPRYLGTATFRFTTAEPPCSSFTRTPSTASSPSNTPQL